ncbi:MAG: putative DNA-binding domain-containing protein [Rhodobacteraceae bacterium]|nr:putative DNA-binding domain-containing protein [Paracoccaceae bacterium]
MSGQTEFTGAILDAAQAVPEGLIDPQGRSAGRRFNVYRNNVAVSLTDALGTAFPVVKKLIGAQNFDALAGIFLRQHPPSSPLMMFYGEEMPGFLEGFAPLQHIRYLPDVARLELALRHAYHAADAQALNPTVLQETAPETLMASRLRFAPAVRLVPSAWPIHAIWTFNMVEGAPKPQGVAEPTLITRPEHDPVQTPLSPGAATFVGALIDGLPFGQAVDSGTQTGAFDLSETLGVLLSGGAITALEPTP